MMAGRRWNGNRATFCRDSNMQCRQVSDRLTKERSVHNKRPSFKATGLFFSRVLEMIRA